MPQATPPILLSLAVGSGRLVEVGVGFGLDSIERALALGVAVVLQGARSDATVGAAQLVFEAIRRGSPIAAQAAGGVTALSVLMAGRVVLLAGRTAVRSALTVADTLR